MSGNRSAKQHAIIMWVIWLAFLQSVFVVQILIGKGLPEGENAQEPMALWIWIVCFAPLIVSTVIRWLVIPKIEVKRKQLVALLIGMGLAEVPVYFQLFLMGPDYPQNQIAVLMVAVVCLIQHAPSYATPGYGNAN
jgi:heme/copper-type cytochrome/quinol oxidase subunit 4